MIYLLALFVILPMAELLLLIEIGRYIGTLPTLGLIVVTGIVGASLARWQGLGVLQRIRRETAQGRLPAGEMVDGVIILIAGAVLMTPGGDGAGDVAGYRRPETRRENPDDPGVFNPEPAQPSSIVAELAPDLCQR